MSRKIVVQPSVLDSTAQKIEAQSADYEKQYGQLFNEVDGMGAAWKGQDNTAFVTQIKGFMDDFQQMNQLMKEYAEFLRTSAKTYNDTQQEVISQAKRLTN